MSRSSDLFAGTTALPAKADILAARYLMLGGSEGQTVIPLQHPGGSRSNTQTSMFGWCEGMGLDQTTPRSPRAAWWGPEQG